MYINTCQQIYLKADRIYHSSKTKTTETNLTEDVKQLNVEGWSLLLSLPGSGLNSWLGNSDPTSFTVCPRKAYI